MKTEHNLKGKSIKNTINEKMSTQTRPLTSIISQLLDKGKSPVTNQNDIAQKDEVVKVESTESHIQNDKSEKQNNDIVIRDDVKVKSSIIFDETKAYEKIDTFPLHQDNSKELNYQNNVEISHHDVIREDSHQSDDTSVSEIKAINSDTKSEFSDFNNLITDLQAFAGKNTEQSIEELTNKPISIESEAKQDKTNSFLINEKNGTNKDQSNIIIPKILETEQTELIHNTPRISSDMNLEIGLLEQKNENDILNKSQNGIMTSSSEIIYKNKIPKLQLRPDDQKKQEEKTINVQVELMDESNTPEKIMKDDDNESIEVIEEIVYVDGVEGEEDEEIIEETIETTVVETPDANSETIPFSDSYKGPITTTVRKITTRKILSTSAPDEITTVEETVVSGNTPEHENTKLSFQVGIGKSHVNMSVGNKNIEIGKPSMLFGKHEEQENKKGNQDLTIKLDKSGLKFNRNKNKMSKNTKNGEPSADALKNPHIISPEKSKKSKTLPNLKIFKTSISTPTTPNIEEVKDESPLDVVSKKKGRSTSSLFNVGKSKSKSPEILNKNDVETDANVSFLGQERRMSTVSTIDHCTKVTDGDKVVVIPKISIKTTCGNISSSQKEK